MNDSFKKRGDALEGDYFRKQDEIAVARLKKRLDEEKPRLSPITGEPMEQKTYHGVIIDVCPTSGGIFLDKGELEIILKNAASDQEDQKGFLAGLLGL